MKEEKETRGMRWADYEDEESRAQEAREEERRVQEAHEEERKAQEAREEEKRAQEAQDEERRAQEAQEEERRAQEAQEEERRAQEAREEQRRAEEAREKETRAQEEQAREERKAKEEREEEREVEAQEGHEEAKEVTTTQEKCVEAKKENSMHEENDVSNRHMTWWRNAWWIRMDGGPHMQTARGRRRIWRAARRAAEQARDGDRVEEIQRSAGEAEGERWGRKKREQGRNRREESNTLHVVFHFPTANTEAAAAVATVRLQ